MKEKEENGVNACYDEMWQRGIDSFCRWSCQLTRNPRLDDFDAQMSQQESMIIVHPVRERDLLSMALPHIAMSKSDRQRVVELLNNLSIKNVQEALTLLFTSEAGMDAPISMEIVVGQEVSKCNRANRACTNGKTIWISLAMFEGENAPTEQEIGFKVPPSVKPGTIVVLHEFAHVLMGHPYNTVTSTEVKEKRADAWVQKFVEPLW